MKNIGVKLRILVYIAIIIAIILLKYTDILDVGCYINRATGLQCPTCGFTRATFSILRFDIKSAIEYNAFYTLVFFPIFIILVMQDLFCITMRLITKKDYISFIEVIFSGKYNIIYVIIVLIFICFAIWSIIRIL